MDLLRDRQPDRRDHRHGGAGLVRHRARRPGRDLARRPGPARDHRRLHAPARDRQVTGDRGQPAAPHRRGCGSAVTWVPVFADVQESVAKYPNIETGEEFNGYEIPGQAGQNHGHPGGYRTSQSAVLSPWVTKRRWPDWQGRCPAGQARCTAGSRQAVVRFRTGPSPTSRS